MKKVSRREGDSAAGSRVRRALGCKQQSTLVEVVDSAVVGTAGCCPGSADTLWKERAPTTPALAAVPPIPSLLAGEGGQTRSRQRLHDLGGQPQGPARSMMPGQGDPLEEFWRRFQDGAPERAAGRAWGRGSSSTPRATHHQTTTSWRRQTEIRIRLDDAREFEAKVVGRDPKTTRPAQAAHSRGRRGARPAHRAPGRLGCGAGRRHRLRGGKPLRLDHSVSMGIVSAKERVIGAGPTTTSSRPTRRSTRGTPGARCSTPAAKWWASTPPSSRRAGHRLRRPHQHGQGAAPAAPQERKGGSRVVGRLHPGLNGRHGESLKSTTPGGCVGS